MRRLNCATALAFFAFCAATCQTAAQTAATQPKSFEVASVKLAAPMDGGRGGRGGGRPSPNQVMFTNSAMMQILMNAYGVKPYQISGPAWLDTERYDIVAKLPEGTTRADSPAMLRTLLAERFRLVAHRETKELPMYSLVVAKNGPKVKESEAAAAPAPGGDAALPPGLLPLPSERKMGPDGFAVMPAGLRGGSTQMQMMPGRMKMKFTMQTMARFADMLSSQLDRAVIDQTGLTKTYDFILEFAPESGGRNPIGLLLAMRQPADPGAPGAPESDAAPGLFSALQEQLGFKLEPKKGPVEPLVIDHLEKIPTEN